MEIGHNVLSQPARAFSSLLAPNAEPDQARRELKDPGNFLLTLRAPPRTLKAGVRGGGTTFSRLASGHSVSIQSVATSPIRLSPLAMFL